MEYTPEQLRCGEAVLKWYKNWYAGVRTGRHPQWFAYSGGPGTGKTTILKEIISQLGLRRHEYMSCAFVGKAVQNLHRHGLNGMTFHSLVYDLSYVSEEDDFGRKRMKMKFVLKTELTNHYKLIVCDEATMLNDSMVEELLSFNTPVIFIGDADQLPPVFGISSVMMNPDFTLTQIMRQKEDDPIIMLARAFLYGDRVDYGDYGLSSVIRRSDLTNDMLVQADQVLTTTNRERFALIDYIRKDINGAKNDNPKMWEKVICRKNNKNVRKEGYMLTNGLAGRITNIDRSEVHKGSYIIDFKPDFFTPDQPDFENIPIDIKHLLNPMDNQDSKAYSKFNIFEYGYAITVHLSQGSEYDNVLFLDGNIGGKELTRKAQYTAITRAKKKVIIVR